MQRMLRGFLALPLLVGCAHAYYTTAAPPQRLQQAVRDSQFVFRGTVRQLGAATMPGVPVSAKTVVVTVDEVISAPKALGDQTGRNVTVALRQAGSVRVGQQAVFFTESWIYGSGLAVREVDRLDGLAAAVDLRASVAEAKRRNEEADLSAQLARAELVVSGHIVRIEKVSEEERRMPLSEHNPDLHRAFLQVESVLKGQAPPQGLVSFLFANSRDVMWDRSPKPKVGQAGVWLLLRNEEPALRFEDLTAFNPRDVQSPERAETVRRLLASPQGPSEPRR